jgi:hypothetical protein
MSSSSGTGRLPDEGPVRPGPTTEDRRQQTVDRRPKTGPTR